MDWEKEIIKAWKFLRENENTIPSEILDFMRDCALKQLTTASTGQPDKPSAS